MYVRMIIISPRKFTEGAWFSCFQSMKMGQISTKKPLC